jgi:hypothetical protein
MAEMAVLHLVTESVSRCNIGKAGSVARMVETQNMYRNLLEKPARNIHFEVREGNNRMKLKKKGYEDWRWIQLAQDRV